MPVLHNIAKETNATSGQSRLRAFLEGRKQSENPVEDWESYEQTLHALFMEAECEVMAEELARLDVDAPYVMIDGLRYHRVLRALSTPALKRMLTQECQAVLDIRPDLQGVKLADGAKDNWHYLSTAFPVGIEWVDFFHSAQHLESAITAAYGQDSALTEADLDKYRRMLKEESTGVAKVIRHLYYLAKKHPRREPIKEALANHLPIGSDVVEPTCKSLVTQRLKCSWL